MIWNNTFDPKFRSHYGKRSPLTAAVSKDQGRTWQHVRDIETDPKKRGESTCDLPLVLVVGAYL